MQGEPTRTFDLIGYAGNGQADLADFSAAGTVLHTVTFWGEQPEGIYQLDVTEEVNSLLTGGATHFGLRADAVNNVVDGGLDAPRLSINGLPPAAGRRDWETIPNAIRADGVESFRVEVNLYGEVRSVVIPFAPYVVGEGPAPYLLRDDGTGGGPGSGRLHPYQRTVPLQHGPGLCLPFRLLPREPRQPAGDRNNFRRPPRRHRARRFRDRLPQPSRNRHPGPFASRRRQPRRQHACSNKCVAGFFESATARE